MTDTSNEAKPHDAARLGDLDIAKARKALRRFVEAREALTELGVVVPVSAVAAEHSEASLLYAAEFYAKQAIDTAQRRQAPIDIGDLVSVRPYPDIQHARSEFLELARVTRSSVYLRGLDGNLLLFRRRDGVEYKGRWRRIVPDDIARIDRCRPLANPDPARGRITDASARDIVASVTGSERSSVQKYQPGRHRPTVWQTGDAEVYVVSHDAPPAGHAGYRWKRLNVPSGSPCASVWASDGEFESPSRGEGEDDR